MECLLRERGKRRKNVFGVHYIYFIYKSIHVLYDAHILYIWYIFNGRDTVKPVPLLRSMNIYGGKAPSFWAENKVLWSAVDS